MQVSIAKTWFYFGLQLQLHYEILPWLEVSVGILNNFDFIQIDAPSREADFFSGGSVLIPSVGLRFNVYED